MTGDTNAEGTAGTYGCACLARDAMRCASMRYGMDHPGEPCECLCHEWDADDDALYEEHYCQCDEVPTEQELDLAKCSSCGRQLI
jgi:hypothetical protein